MTNTVSSPYPQARHIQSFQITLKYCSRSRANIIGLSIYSSQLHELGKVGSVLFS